MVTTLALLPGVMVWREKISHAGQQDLLSAVLTRLEMAPFYRPRMPGSDKEFSVEESNFGSLGWISDKTGYRYQANHPVTGAPWPDIPPALMDLWRGIADAPDAECCLVNLYRNGARMGLHQDKDERNFAAPVVSVSLGDEALFRIGGETRRGPTQSVVLSSGDVVMFGGSARLAYHGIDRVRAGSSSLIPGGGRINLTLRRVNA
ncbi:MAG TPA: alpha-ketoglutarate-dependent dioxygenase AlkB [Rhizomicrobium sp.]|nr:alpha-ketoglutarate-dependent dioxygenase AlkB [Rhizomicrobium sp.]